MPYAAKEIYYTLQGEGAHTGRPAVFLRFAGCNLWSGLEADRAGAECDFCDTRFVGTDGPGGGKFTSAGDLAAAVRKTWPHHDLTQGWVVCTGGEPLLQLDSAAIDALRASGFRIAVETNGTLAAPPGIDWLCVSPKAGTNVIQRTGDELKIVYPQSNLDPETYADWKFSHFFLQPLDGPHVQEHTRATLEYCLAHPQWRMSLQTHKILGIA